jgi:DNA-binding transcriptional ArsR family regulator
VQRAVWKTKQSVLALHYGHAYSSFYTKQVLDAVKSGRRTVQRELKNLTETGIIIREVQGRLVYYGANAKYPIFNELKIIVRKTFGMASTPQPVKLPPFCTFAREIGKKFK